MKTYPNQTKSTLLAQVSERHRRLGKSTPVGCLLGNINFGPNRAPDLLGIPVWMVYLADAICENLATDEAPLWPEQFLAALPEGATLDWDHIERAFLVRTLRRLPSVTPAVQGVIDLLERESEVTPQEWGDARTAARIARNEAATCYDADAAYLAAYYALDRASATNAYSFTYHKAIADSYVASDIYVADAARAAAHAYGSVAARPFGHADYANYVDAVARAGEASRQRDDILELISCPLPFTGCNLGNTAS